METCVNLTLSFYRAIQQDVKKLYPEHEDEIDSSFDWLLAAQPSDSEKLLMIKSLCQLGKAMEQSLITPKLLEVPAYFPLWEGSVLPVFLHFLFEGLFFPSGLRSWARQPNDERISGEIASAVFVLRQILLAFSKAEDLPCDRERTDELLSFRQRVTKKPAFSVRYPKDFQLKVYRTARILLNNVLMRDDINADSCLSSDRLVAPLAQWSELPFGKHGPGAVAGEETGFGKWDFTPDPRTNRITSYGSEFEPLYCQYEGELTTLGVNGHSVVTLVPKDFRGRRIICIEPKELMFAQRGLMDVLFDIVHTNQLTRRSINFRRQELSQRFIQRRGIATIDLKDASDMVSLDLVKALFPRSFVELVSKFRSPHLYFNEMLPNEEGDWVAPNIVKYETAFTMGNALCFPIETLTFWALSLATMIECSTPYLWHRAQDYIGGIGSWTPHTFEKHFPLRVFGDDIAVPARFYSDVCETLTEAGLSVNELKSCCETPVRESCGAWLFNNTDVRITRFAFAQLSDTRVWDSWHKNAIELQENGLTGCSACILEHLVEYHPTARAFLGLQPRGACIVGHRWNKDLQRVEVLVPSISNEGARLHLNGEAGIYAAFTSQGTDRTASHGDSQRVKWLWVDAITHQR